MFSMGLSMRQAFGADVDSDDPNARLSAGEDDRLRRAASRDKDHQIVTKRFA